VISAPLRRAGDLGRELGGGTCRRKSCDILARWPWLPVHAAKRPRRRLPSGP